MENQPVITFSTTQGDILSFTVPNHILVAVYQSIMESPDCNSVPALSLPSEPAPIIETVDLEPIIKRGSRPGYIELHFASKPGKEQLGEIKNAGFHWSVHNACWYGHQENCPERYDIPLAVIPAYVPETVAPTSPRTPRNDTGGTPARLIPETPVQPPSGSVVGLSLPMI